VGAACLVLCADDPGTILPTVTSRSARVSLGPVSAEATARLLEDEGLADAPRALALARAAGGSPGLALALARSPEALLLRERVVRQIADLLTADRRARLGASASLMADGTALDAALRGALTPEPEEDAPPARSRGSRAGTRLPAARASARPEPADRRRAVRRILGLWREVGRDLAVAVDHAPGRVRNLDVLEELTVAAGSIEAGELLLFLDRLDGWVVALDAYASPELILDGVLLAWPRARALLVAAGAA
jgi:hypothetical protein